MYCSGSPFSDKVCICISVFWIHSCSVSVVLCLCHFLNHMVLSHPLLFLFELQILYMEICHHPLGNSVLFQTGLRKLAARAVPGHCRAAGTDVPNWAPSWECCWLPRHSSLWCVWPRGLTQTLVCLPALCPVGTLAPACLSNSAGLLASALPMELPGA